MKKIFTLFFVMGSLCAMATIRYAKPTPTGLGDGSSWANASDNLDSLTRNSNLGDEIWVSQGIYFPTEDLTGVNSFNNHFMLKDGVKWYGGFSGNGTETIKSQRDFVHNITILGNVNYAVMEIDEGAFVAVGVNQVVVSISDGPGTEIDGFTVNGGYANDPRNVFYDPDLGLNGAGMYLVASSVSISNCIIAGAHADSVGAGMYIKNSNPVITNCTFRNNGAYFGGGAICNDNSSPTITGCIFSGNGVAPFEYFDELEPLHGGGAIYNRNNSAPTISHCIFSENAGTSGGAIDNYNFSSPVIDNCLFTNNSSFFYGGAVRSEKNSSIELINCTIYASNTSAGGAIYNQENSNASIRNTIIWGNLANGIENSIENVDGSGSNISYSDIKGSGGSGSGWVVATGTDGGGNIDANPWFSSTIDLDGADNKFGTADDGLALLPCSPAVNTGDNTNIGTSDITGAARIFGGTVDMGAYELQQSGGTVTVYQDLDGDGYGNPAVSLQGCQPGYINNNGDCNDTDAVINAATIWYKDVDNDGYSDGNTINQCVQPAGYRLASNLMQLAGDCDDTNASIHPRAIEIVGNCIDENCSGPAQRIYVNALAAPGGNGETWQCAIKELRDAIAMANNNSAIEQIWVAKGTYKPTAGNDRTASFNINRRDLDIIGGFAGTETLATQADPVANVTSISGDIGTLGSMTDNSYHILKINKTSDRSTLNIIGFKIEKGNANSSNNPLDENAHGGAVSVVNEYDHIIFSSCAFSENNASVGGGAVYLRGEKEYDAYGSITFKTCGFYANTSAKGGAVQIDSLNTDFDQVIFRENRASSGNGGAVFCSTKKINFTNAAFDKNSSSANGGAVYQEMGTLTYHQCVFNGNKAGISGGAIFQDGQEATVSSSTLFANAATINGGAIMRNGTASLTIRNDIFWKNSKNGVLTGPGADIVGSDLILAANNNMFQAATAIPADNGGNIFENQRGVNPLFLNEAKPSGVDDWLLWQTDGLELSAASPAINTAGTYSFLSKDIQEKPRLQCEAFDKGAYEYQGCPALKLKPGAIVGVPIRKNLFATTDIKATVTNPFSSRLDIHYSGTEKASLNITDPTGKPMQKTMTIQPGLTSIYTGVWASGIYQVAIYTNGRPAVFKVVKVK